MHCTKKRRVCQEVYAENGRWGILLNVDRGGKRRCLLAGQVWTGGAGSSDVTILDHCGDWIGERDGLMPGFG